MSRFGIHFDIDGTFPRIIGSLTDAYLATLCLNIGLALDIEVHIDVIRLCSIHIKRYGSDKACDIARAASASEPCLTFMLSH